MSTGRTVRRIATGALLAAGAAVLVGGYVLRRPVPGGRGKVSLKGLREGAEIIRDRWGVPHIYTSSVNDAAFAVGYAQAQDRLWQMELNRRAASGTLAELLGEQALEIDRMTRRIGFRRAAERDWREADKEERAVLEAYSAGVNAYLDRAKMPLEFTILRSRPASWTPVDSLAFGRLFGWALTGNWDSEIVRSWTIERYGAEGRGARSTGRPAENRAGGGIRGPRREQQLGSRRHQVRDGQAAAGKRPSPDAFDALDLVGDAHRFAGDESGGGKAPPPSPP